MRSRHTGEEADKDRGAILVWCALMSTVLVGFGAIVVDVGRMYVEKRELQNGADAAALGVAQLCVRGTCTSATAVASALANANAKDSSTRVSICGRGITGVPACATTPAGVAADQMYVQATAQTSDPSNEDPNRLNLFLRPILDRAGVDPSLTATATVAIGAPDNLTSLNLTLSLCEFERVGGVIGAGTVSTATVEIKFREDATPCVRPNGFALPGGFGWLAGANRCIVPIQVPANVGERPGKNGDNDCDVSTFLNKPLQIPVFSSTNGLGGTNGVYHIDGFATWVTTAYSFPGSNYPNGFRCSLGASYSCVVGHFTSALVTTGRIGGGVDYATRAVALVG